MHKHTGHTHTQHKEGKRSTESLTPTKTINHRLEAHAPAIKPEETFLLLGAAYEWGTRIHVAAQSILRLLSPILSEFLMEIDGEPRVL